MSEIILPHQWKARPHQTNFFTNMLPEALGGKGLRRAVCVWHRRAGKDSTSLNFTSVMAHHEVGTYWHLLPTAIQGRHVAWDMISNGTRIIDQVFPEELRKQNGVNETDMRIKLKNGSTWQVVGSDNYDRLVGANPRGVVFSEYSLSNPEAWNYIRPILKENGGWAIFIFTYRGKNHAFDLHKMAKNNPLWYEELLDIDHTWREDNSPVFSQKDYQEELDDGMDPLLALQEYYCSPDAGMEGAYYTHELTLAKYGDYPWNPNKPVHTFWDIGIKDATSIWFGQESNNGDAINIIDYITGKDRSFPQWISELKNKGYTYGVHSMPHDFKKRAWKDGGSAVSVARELNFEIEITPDLTRAQGIDASRRFFPRCCFDNNPDVLKGLEGLRSYRREYNTKLQTWMDRPLHDWAADPADAFRYMAIAWPDSYNRTGLGNFRVIKTHSAMQPNRSAALDMARRQR